MFQRLRSGKNYPESVVSVLSGKMQSRSVRLGDNPSLHPNYYRSAPNESPSQTRKAIAGAFVLRLVGPLGIDRDELFALQYVDEPVGDLIGMDYQPVLLSRLNIIKQVQILDNNYMLEERAHNKVAPTFMLARLLINFPDQAYTVYPSIGRPSQQDAMEVHIQYQHAEQSQVG